MRFLLLLLYSSDSTEFRERTTVTVRVCVDMNAECCMNMCVLCVCVRYVGSMADACVVADGMHYFEDVR